MNPQLDQFRQLLNDYKETIAPIFTEGVVRRPEYMAWISCTMEEDSWPTEGEFPIARENLAFRAFRAVYKKCYDAIGDFDFDRWDIMPRSKRKEFQKIWEKETGVPF